MTSGRAGYDKQVAIRLKAGCDGPFDLMRPHDDILGSGSFSSRAGQCDLVTVYTQRFIHYF
jgi:hypothetical protein